MQELTTFIMNHQILVLAMMIVIALLLVIELIRARRRIYFATPSEIVKGINHDNAVVIDIRTPEAFQKGHIVGALSMSGHEIRNHLKKLEKFKEKPIIIVCDNGIESQKLAAILFKLDYNAFSLPGGMPAWIKAEMPLIKE